MLRCRLVGAPGCAALVWASECGGGAAFRLGAAAADDDAEEDEAPARGTLLSRPGCPALALSKDRLPLAAVVDAGCSELLAASGAKHGSAGGATLLARIPV